MARCTWGKDLWKIPWIEVSSPHFTVVSSISAERTVKLVQGLEDFRAAVALLTSIGRFEERIPTRLYILPHGDGAFGLGDGVAGYFIPEMRANYAAVVPQPGGGIGDVVRHEYVHFLVHNDGGRNYPRWFDEGFAQMLQTLEVRGKTIEFGQPPSYAIDNLRYGTWLPYQRILRISDALQLGGGNTSMFYAQSWLLVHYLQAGRPDHAFQTENDGYLSTLETGVDPTAAFETAFGMKVIHIHRTVSRYAARDLKSFVFTLKQPFAQASTVVVPVAPSSIASRLAELLIVRSAYDAAKPYLDAAIALDPQNGAALVGLADLHKFAGRFDEAQPYYEKAIAAEPKNAYHQLDYGEFFLGKARAAGHDAEAVANDLIEARRRFARSDALDPTVPETLAMNGWTYLFPGQSIDKGIASLVAAQEMLPSQPDIAELLATAYAQAGRKDEAVKLIRAALAWHDADDANVQEARKLLEEWTTSEDKDDRTEAEAADTETEDADDSSVE